MFDIVVLERRDTVELREAKDDFRRWFVVRDDHYHVRICPDREKEAIFVDVRPGRRQRFCEFNAGSGFLPGEVTVTETGVLTAMSRKATAAGIEIHDGWTAKLPPSAVSLVSKAIALGEAALLPEIQQPAAFQEMDYHGEPFTDAVTWRARPLSSIGLSARPFNTLSAQGVHTLYDLLLLSEIDLLRIKGLGKKGCWEIRQTLRSMGLDLGDARVYASG